MWSDPALSGEETTFVLWHFPHPKASIIFKIKYSYRKESLKPVERTSFSISEKMAKLLGQTLPEKAVSATELSAIRVVLHVFGC